MAVAGWMLAAAWPVLGGAAMAAPIDDLKSEEAAVRKQAARELGDGKSDKAVSALAGALQNDSAAPVRAAAAKSLGALRDPDAVEALMGALSDDDQNVRFYAADALGEIKEPAAAPALIAALGDREWLVRDQAAWALREIHSEASLPDLFAALRAGGDRERIAWILKGFDDTSVRAGLEKLFQNENAGDRLLVVRALEAFRSSEAFDGLLSAAVGDADAKVRMAALTALCERKTENLRNILRDRLGRETDLAVRELIDTALSDLSEQLQLIGHWSFDDRGEKVAKDVTGGGSDGEMKGGVPDEGKAGAGLRLGGGHYVELGKPPNLPIAGKSFTVAAWVKPETEDGVIVARGGATCGFSLHLTGGKPGFGIRRSADEEIFLATATEPLPDGWVHLAGTVEKDRISVYVNGKLAASTETPGPMTGNCGQAMEIGIDLSNSAVEVMAPFEGIIDEVRMYHTALTEEDLADVIAADGDK